jgi:polar amino acid transport system substrate-binding protein
LTGKPAFTATINPLESDMRTRFLLVLTCFCAWLGSALAQTPTITVSTNNTPLDRKALEELSQEAFSRIGVEFKLVSLPSERSLFAANLGEVDGEGLRVAGLGSQYLNLVQVPERYIGISFVAFTRDLSIKLDKGWDSLKPYSVAFITGWKMFEANVPVAKAINRVEKPEQLFRMLDGGRVDVVLYTRADGQAMVRSLGFKGIVPLSPALKDVDMYLYLHKKHEALVPRLAKALRDMKADGTYNRIMQSIKAD